MFLPANKTEKHCKKENINKTASEKTKERFVCCECGEQVEFSGNLGTAHRNHCPRCLSSKHLDKELSGDRAANCGGCMKAIALSFKKEGFDKYGKEREGELMIVHKCLLCGAISINRLAADDDETAILSLFNESLFISDEIREKISAEGIDIASKEDKEKVFVKLFGKSIGKV